jgi:hypothetical protein
MHSEMTKIPLKAKKKKIDLGGLFCLLIKGFFFFVNIRSNEGQLDLLTKKKI